MGKQSQSLGQGRKELLRRFAAHRDGEDFDADTGNEYSCDVLRQRGRTGGKHRWSRWFTLGRTRS